MGRCLLVSAPNIKGHLWQRVPIISTGAEEAEETEMKLQDEQVTLARRQSHLQRRMIAGRQKKAWSSHEEEAEARKRQRKLLGR